MNQKIENLLNLSLGISESERAKSPDLNSGFNVSEETWELIIKYNGDIMNIQEKYPEIRISPLINRYATIVTPERYIEPLSEEPFIEYIEKPKGLYFELTDSLAESCITPIQLKFPDGQPGLTGKGVIVAIIDTGIDIKSSEFRNPDGTTRILNIWDQDSNTFLDSDDINNIIMSDDSDFYPGSDIIGHGTNVATIACGKSGVAKDAFIIVVKMGLSRPGNFPRTTKLMQAVNYVLLKSVEYSLPVAINISFGNNYGDHTGTSLLETFINECCLFWKNSICVGTGNEGLGATHVGGNIAGYSSKDIKLNVSRFETSLNIQLWKDYQDDIFIEIISPSGNGSGRIDKFNSVIRSESEGTTLLMYYGTPAPYSKRQELYIDMIPNYSYITSGVWTIRILSRRVVTGRYDLWLPSIGSLNFGTGFEEADGSLSFTVPSTASRVISVGAYNQAIDAIAPFSGRGYVTMLSGTTLCKPDLVAPGVNLLINNTLNTGTSYATPFVTGSAALLMEYGITRGNDPFLYGEKIKAYLISGAQPISFLSTLPNPQSGWGKLCVILPNAGA